MKSRPFRLGLIAIEIIGVSLAVIAVVVGISVWRAERGIVELGFIKPALEASLNRILEKNDLPYQTKIGRVFIATDELRRDYYRLSLENIKFASPELSVESITRECAGKEHWHYDVANELLTLWIEKEAILKRRFSVHDAIAQNPIISVTEARCLQKNSDDEDDGIVKPRRFDWRQIVNHPQFKENLQTIDIRNPKVFYHSLDPKRSWHAREGFLRLKKGNNNNFQIVSESQIDLSEKQSDVSVTMDYDSMREIASLDFLGKNVPLGDLATLFGGMPNGFFTAPLSGHAALSVDLTGEILSANFDIMAGEGVFARNELELPVDELRLAGKLDPETKRIHFTDIRFSLGETKGALTGSLGFSPSGRDDSRALIFSLKGEDFQIDSLGYLSEILKISSLNLEGVYDVQSQDLTLDQLDINSDGVRLFGNGRLDFQPEKSIGVQAKLKSDGVVNVARLMTLWPKSLTPLSRRWVKSRISRGYVRDIEFFMDLPPGQFDELGYIPDESLILNFNVEDVSAEFLSGITPLTKGYGRGVLKGNSLKVDVTSGKLSSIQINEGQILFPKFNPGGGEHLYSFKGKGNAREMLSILDEEPLNLVNRSGLSPEQINGSANVDMLITRKARDPKAKPGSPRGFEYDGIAKFENLTFSELFRGIDLDNGRGEIVLKTRDMKISGKCNLGVTPVEIVWNQKFYQEDGPSDFEVKGVFDAALGDDIGIATRSFLRGPVDFSLKATGGYQELETFSIDADFTKAQLGFNQFDLQKRANVPATGKIDASLSSGVISLNKISLISDNIDVEGALSFEQTGRLRTVDFPQFFIDGKADFSLTAHREPGGALALALRGAYLDLDHAIKTGFGAPPTLDIDDQNQKTNKIDNREQAPDKNEFDWGGGIRAEIQLQKLGLRNGININAVTLDFFHDGELLQILNLSGKDNDDDDLQIAMFQKNASNLFDDHSDVSPSSLPRRHIEAKTADLGTLFEGAFGVTSVQGGRGSLSLDLGLEKGAPIFGSATAQDIRIIEAPLLARIFAAGSFDGLGDLLNNQGISLTDASAEFIVDNRLITLRKSKAIGPSIGMTTRGSVALNGKGDIRLEGAIAPAYQINSFLGNTPLIGDLFVSREGEGLVAVTYDVSGKVGAPKVTLNPFMALAPGVIRRAFENGDTKFDQDFIDSEIEEGKAQDQ